MDSNCDLRSRLRECCLLPALFVDLECCVANFGNSKTTSLNLYLNIVKFDTHIDGNVENLLLVKLAGLGPVSIATFMRVSIVDIIIKRISPEKRIALAA